MDVRLDRDPSASLPGYIEGDCFVTWHVRYQKSVAYHEAGHAVAFIVADRTQLGGKVEPAFKTLAYVEALGAMGGQVGINRDFKDYSGLLGVSHPPIGEIDHDDPVVPQSLT